MNEEAFKLYLWFIDKLKYEGHKLFGEVLEKYFTVMIDRDPSVIGYTIPGKNIIAINPDEELDDLILMLTMKHELLHNMLAHAERALMFFEKSGLSSYAEAGFDAGLYEEINKCGDYDISQLYSPTELKAIGWNPETQEVTKGFKFLGRYVRLLILEADHKDWLAKGFEFEDMLRESEKELRKLEQKTPPKGGKGKVRYVVGKLVDRQTFVDETGAVVKH